MVEKYCFFALLVFWISAKWYNAHKTIDQGTLNLDSLLNAKFV